MPTKIFLPTGGLNFDDDPSTLPDGDYIDAVNISKDVGVNGQGNTFRKIEGFTEMDSEYVLPFTIGENSAGDVKIVDIIPDHENRAIYYLIREDTYAFIAKYDIDTDTKSIALPRYAHGGYDADTGNLRILGDMLFWNYLSYNGHSGVPCSWYLPRTFTDTDILTADVLLMAKPAPGPSTVDHQAPIEITAIDTAISIGNVLLSNNDFHFAYRFVYDSGERSVLSPYQLYKGRGSIESIHLGINDQGNDYVEKYEIYARKNESGVWIRIGTTASTSFEWTGDLNEVLSDDESSTPFHLVPLETKTMEVAFNRVFLGNNMMDLDPGNPDITVDLTLPSTDLIDGGGSETAYSYFLTGPNGASQVNYPSNTNLSINESSGWAMPFSWGAFSVGLAFFDDQLRTPGVQIKDLNLYVLEDPFADDFFDLLLICGVTPNIPSWAKYAAICITKNLRADRFYEGYASNVFFEFNNNGDKYFYDRVTDENSGYVESIIIDISAMLKEDHIYSYQEGDRIMLSFDNGTRIVREFEVTGQDGAFVYVKYRAVGLTDGMINGMSNLDFFFNIYSPSENMENLVYYPTSFFKTDILISSATIRFEHLNLYSAGKFLGDCVFKTISYEPYLRNPLKLTPKTTSKIASTFGKDGTTLYDSVSIDFTQFLAFDTIYQNEDGGELTSANTYETRREFSTGGTLKAQLRVNLTYGASASASALKYTFEFRHETLGAAIGGKLFEFFQVIPAGSEGVGFVEDFAFEFDFAAGDIAQTGNDNVIFLRMAIEGDTAVSGNDIEVSNLLVTLVDNDYVQYERVIDQDVPVGTPVNVLVRAMNLNDNLSWARNQSMPLLEVPANLPERKYNEIRHGGPYIQDTLINGISNFTALLSGNTPYENGAITGLVRANKSQSQGSVLLAFTKHETHSVYLGERQIRDTGDSNQLALTSDVIGSINTLQGSYGTSHPSSIQRRMGSVYFWDFLEKKVVRYNRNGLTVISGQVDPRRDPNTKMKKYFRGKTATPHAVYDPYNELYIIWFEGDSRSVAYSERENRWVTFLDYKPLAGTHIDDYLYSLSLVIEQQPGPDLATVILSRGQDPSNYGIFPVDVVFDTLDPEPPHYVEQDSTITFVFANPIPVNLENLTLRHASDVIDWARDNNIKDNLLQVVITNENGQQTTVYEEMLMLERNMLYSHIARDENSPGGLIDGDFMEGYNNKIVLTLENVNTDEQLAIAALSIGYEESSGHKL